MTAEIRPEDVNHSYAGARVYRSRVECIRDLCRAKRVLHVGCVDSGFYETHTAESKFLHADIVESAKSVIGVDVDAEGVRRMLSDGYEQIIVADITLPSGRSEVMALVQSTGGLDEIICGEVIEHVPNPLELVRGLLELSKLTGAAVVITTPNPFYWGRFATALVHREVVHPDHNSYLSATNLKTLVRKSGGAAFVRCDFYRNSSPTWLIGMVKQGLGALFPCLSDGVIMRLKAA